MPSIDVQKTVFDPVTGQPVEVVYPGDTVEWRMTITNTGAAAALDTRLSDPTPGARCSCRAPPRPVWASSRDESPLVVNIGTIPPGGQVTVMFRVTVNRTPRTEIWCRTRQSRVGQLPDIPSDNDGDASNGRGPTRWKVKGLADLRITKSVKPQVVRLGEGDHLHDPGDQRRADAATNVVMTDALPPGVTFVSATADTGSCGATGGTVTCTIPTLASGATATIVVVTTRTSPDPMKRHGDGRRERARSGREPTTPPPPRSTSSVPEDCGNCKDDDGDGLIDAEDDDCCTAQGLTFTSTRLMSRKSQLRAKGRFARGAFAGINPRQETIRLQVRDANGETTCCAVPQEDWKKVLGRVYWARGCAEHVRAGDEPLSDRAEALDHRTVINGGSPPLGRRRPRRHAARRHGVRPG